MKGVCLNLGFQGMYPDDREYVKKNLDRCIWENCEREVLQYRLKTGEENI